MVALLQSQGKNFYSPNLFQSLFRPNLILFAFAECELKNITVWKLEEQHFTNQTVLGIQSKTVLQRPTKLNEIKVLKNELRHVTCAGGDRAYCWRFLYRKSARRCRAAPVPRAWPRSGLHKPSRTDPWRRAASSASALSVHPLQFHCLVHITQIQ